MLKQQKEAKLTALSDIIASSKTAECAILDILKPFDTGYIYYLEAASGDGSTEIFFQFLSKPSVRMDDNLISFVFNIPNATVAAEFVRDIKRFNRRMQRNGGRAAVPLQLVASCGNSFFITGKSNWTDFYSSINNASLRLVFPNKY